MLLSQPWLCTATLGEGLSCGGDGVCAPPFHTVPPLPNSVVGPALTFRIRQNPQNLSLADVASQAGELCKGSPWSCCSLSPEL